MAIPPDNTRSCEILAGKISKKETDVGNAKSSRDEFRETLNEKQRYLDENLEKHAVLTEQIRDIDSDLSDYSSQIDSLNNQLENAEGSEIDSILSEIQAVNGRISGRQEDRTAIKSSLTEVEYNVEQLRERVNQLTPDLDPLNEKLAFELNELERLQDRYNAFCR
ncbi:MAG: hypothetical protein AAF687_07560 [Pseudomonadota bacterium]